MSTELLVIASRSATDEAAAWNECVAQWLAATERRRGSKRTSSEYEKSLRAFFNFARKAPADVTGSDCQRWVASMHQAQLAKSTINARLAAVSSFYNYACHKFEVRPGHYLHAFNPATSVQREHVNPYEKSQGLSIEQARALLGACDRQSVKGMRDYALLAFYIFTGRRRSEIARLVWADLREGTEMGGKEYRYTGKGNKTAWRELPPPVWKALEAYLIKSDRLVGMKPDSPLFTSTAPGAAGDKPIADITVTQIVATAAKKAGLGHLKVHALRHSAAKIRRKNGASLEEISKFLDHASVATTQIYLNATEARKDKGWRKVEADLGMDY